MKIKILDSQNNRFILEINQNDYVRDIKKKIEIKVGYKIGLIHYEGEILDDEEKISSYDIMENDCIIFTRGWKNPTGIKIIIVDSEGYKEKFNNDDITINQLKEDLRNRCGIKSEIKLFYEGNILDNNEFTWDICQDSLYKDENLIIFYDGKFKQK